MSISMIDGSVCVFALREAIRSEIRMAIKRQRGKKAFRLFAEGHLRQAKIYGRTLHLVNAALEAAIKGGGR